MYCVVFRNSANSNQIHGVSYPYVGDLVNFILHHVNCNVLVHVHASEKRVFSDIADYVLELCNCVAGVDYVANYGGNRGFFDSTVDPQGIRCYVLVHISGYFSVTPSWGFITSLSGCNHVNFIPFGISSICICYSVDDFVRDYYLTVFETH